MASTPEVSVVIPTRCRWNLLRDSLGGALRQQDVELEVVVVDDGSMDETPARLEEIGDARLRVVRNERPEGVARARNRGIAEASGTWVAFLDDDDLWSPDKLRAQLDAAHREDAAWVYAAAVILDSRRRVIGADPFPDADQIPRLLLSYCAIPGGCSNVLVRRELLNQVRGFDDDLSVLADWDLWIALSELEPPASCPHVLIGYVLHQQNMHVSKRHRRMTREFERLSAKHRAASLASGVEFDRAAFLYWTAGRYQRAGRRAQAGRAYIAAARELRSWRALLRAMRSLFAWRTPDVKSSAEPDWLVLYR